MLTRDLFAVGNLLLSILSVRLSVQCQYCVERNGLIVTRFDALIGTSFYFLPAPSPLQNFKGSPLSGDVKYKGWEIL